MTDKERIESEADDLNALYRGDQFMKESRKKFYVAGATHERSLMEKEKIEVRNSTLDEALERMTKTGWSPLTNEYSIGRIKKIIEEMKL